ncbi:MAG: DUF4175 domain-containing protein, partial [Alphaproteobacteria bacterium]|nr:DUF4175 domain-containing protein [Alphaproteobacteria bacterium]
PSVLASTADGRQRIERDSGLVHRPLTALTDRLATGAGDPATLALWQAHLLAAASGTRRLSLKPPAPNLAARDPVALRAAALLLLAVGLIGGYDDAARRFVRALNPGSAATDPRALDLEVWITPPAHTRRAPVFLRRGQDGEPPAVPPMIPWGSAVLAQATGPAAPLRLKAGSDGAAFVPLAAGAASPSDENGRPRAAQRAELTLETSDATALIVVTGGREIHRWPIRLVADRAPEVSFLAPPSAAAGARLRIDFEASDDYGVVQVTAVIRRRPSADADVEELRVPLQMGAPGPKAHGVSLHDLSAHPWSGTEVMVHLEAADAIGQIGVSDSIAGRMPERFFNHPVARALADARRQLADPSPRIIEESVMELERLSARPQHFGHDTVAYLAMRLVIGRLVRDPGPQGLETVRAVLWETALRIEDGKFAAAGRDLRDLQRRLADALREKGGDRAEAERLLDEIKRALDKLFAELAKEMEQGGAEPVPFDPETMQVVDSADLYRMIEEARELMRMGAMDAARQMLAELQRMLQGLQRGMAAMPRQGEGQKAARAMRDLRELAQRQQQLLDRTFRRARRGGDQDGRDPGTGGKPGGIDEGRAQQALRRMLGRMMTEMDEMLGKIPDSLGGAERAMRDAEQALRQGNASGAIGPQSEALAKLREAMQGIGEQLARRMGGVGAAGEMPAGAQGPGRDPFGREQGGAMGSTGGEVRVPDRGERLRAREIMDELRRRAGERDRPALERDYIERLLRMF